MHMQSNNDEKNIDFLTHLQEKLPLRVADLTFGEHNGSF